MTAQQVKLLLPIIQAFADGKQIQIRYGDIWKDQNDFKFTKNNDDYRIKPEPISRSLNESDIIPGSFIRLKTHTSSWYSILATTLNGISIYHTSAGITFVGWETLANYYEIKYPNKKDWQLCTFICNE